VYPVKATSPVNDSIDDLRPPPTAWVPDEAPKRPSRGGGAAPSGWPPTEIGAHLSLPLGVARVLVGDLVVQGYVRVHATLDEAATADERRELIGRTLFGLRAL
jgi:uncharacterized protein DUF742